MQQQTCAIVVRIDNQGQGKVLLPVPRHTPSLSLERINSHIERMATRDSKIEKYSKEQDIILEVGNGVFWYIFPLCLYTNLLELVPSIFNAPEAFSDLPSKTLDISETTLRLLLALLFNLTDEAVAMVGSESPNEIVKLKKDAQKLNSKVLESAIAKGSKVRTCPTLYPLPGFLQLVSASNDIVGIPYQYVNKLKALSPAIVSLMKDRDVNKSWYLCFHEHFLDIDTSTLALVSYIVSNDFGTLDAHQILNRKKYVLTDLEENLEKIENDFSSLNISTSKLRKARLNLLKAEQQKLPTSAPAEKKFEPVQYKITILATESEDNFSLVLGSAHLKVLAELSPLIKSMINDLGLLETGDLKENCTFSLFVHNEILLYLAHKINNQSTVRFFESLDWLQGQNLFKDADYLDVDLQKKS